MGKHLVDLDEDALADARATLGTDTIKATVNEALRRAADDRQVVVENLLTALSEVDFDDRSSTWR